MNNALIATQILIQLLQQADAFARLLNQANAEGRDVTDAELDGLSSGDDAAKKALQELIDRKRAGN